MPQVEDLGADTEAEVKTEKIGGAEPPKDLITESDMSLPLDPLRNLGMPDDEEEDDEVCWAAEGGTNELVKVCW